MAEEKYDDNTRFLLDIMDQGDPVHALEELSTFILNRTDSSAVAIYYTRKVGGIPSLVTLHDSQNNAIDSHEESKTTNYRPLFTGKGASEWVLDHNDWLYGNSFNWQDLKKDLPFSYQSSNGAVELVPSISSDWCEDRDRDEETAICFFPLNLHSNGVSDSPNAVLCLRKDPDNESSPYELKDIEEIYRFQKIVQICCRHVIRIQQNIHERKVLHGLMRIIDNIRYSPVRSRRACISAVAEIVDSSCILLIEQVYYEEEKKYIVYCSDIVTSEKIKEKVNLEGAFGKFSYSSEKSLINENSDLKNNINKCWCKYKENNDVQYKMELNEVNGFRNCSAIVVLDLSINKEPFLNYAWSIDDLNVLKNLVDRIGKLYKLHLKTTIRNNLRKIKEECHGKEIDDYNHSVVKQLTEISEADYAMLYFVTKNNEVKLIRYYKKDTDIHKISNIQIEKTLTERSLQKGENVFIPDISVNGLNLTKLVNRDVLSKVVKRGHADQTVSWACFPFGYTEKLAGKTEHRGLGVIKLVSLKSSASLSQVTEEICSAFSEFVFQYYREHNKVTALKTLNAISRSISNSSGKRLGKALISELEGWASTFLKIQCSVLLLTRNNWGKLLCVSTKDLEDDHEYIEKHAHLEKSTLIHLNGRKLWICSAAISMEGVNELKGTLHFVCKTPFISEHQKLIKEAAVDITVLMFQEHMRHQRKREMTRFRHTIIAPVQGYYSSAGLALRIAKKTGKEIKKIKQIESTLNIDNIIIRNWISLSRMLVEDEVVKIRPRLQELKPLLENCMARYKDAAQQRGINLVWDTENSLTGGVLIEFDNFAMDIVISNILDNAVKYAFMNTNILVQLYTDNTYAVITIIDYGHALPNGENFLKEYTQGTHFTWDDPYRIIPGEGYGIAIIRSLIHAHRGRLTFFNEEEVTHGENSGDERKKKYKVSAVIRLPHRWRGRNK